MHPIFLYNHAKKLERFLEPFWGKGQKSKKNRHLIPYSPGLYFSEKEPSYTMRPDVLYNHAKHWEDPEG